MAAKIGFDIKVIQWKLIPEVCRSWELIFNFSKNPGQNCPLISDVTDPEFCHPVLVGASEQCHT